MLTTITNKTTGQKFTGHAFETRREAETFAMKNEVLVRQGGGVFTRRPAQIIALRSGKFFVNA